MKTLFEYIDYRKFLSEYYLEKKDNTKYFSYRYFSQAAGIKSPSFLKQVIDGKRNLTNLTIEKFCLALNLNSKEALYFRHLVLFNQATIGRQKQEHYSVLRSLSKSVKESVLRAAQYDYFDKWYTVVIRELVCLYNFRDDYEEIGKSLLPSVPGSAVKQAINLLLKLELLIKNKDNSFSQSDKAIVVDEDVTSLAIRNFTKKMFDHAQSALENVEKSKRNISGLTIGISPRSYDIITSEIEAFKDRIKRVVADDDDSSQVYQLNVALFPMSKNMKNKKGHSND